MLWMPDEVSTMRPEWSSCGKAIWGVYDPPHALQTAKELTPDTSSSQSKEPHISVPATTTPAAPVDGHQTAPAAPAHTQPEASKPTQSPEGSSGPELNAPGDQGHASGGQGSGNQDPASQKPDVQDPQRSDPAPASNVVDHIGNAIASAIGLVMPDGTVTQNALGSTASATLERFDSAGIVVHGTTVPFSKVGNGYQAATTTDASGAHVLVLGSGSTLTVGGKATTINGHTVSAGEDGIVVDGSATIAYAGSTAAPRKSSISSGGVLQVTTSGSGIMRVSCWMVSSSLLLILILAYL